MGIVDSHMKLYEWEVWVL